MCFSELTARGNEFCDLFVVPIMFIALQAITTLRCLRCSGERQCAYRERWALLCKKESTPEGMLSCITLLRRYRVT